MEKEVIVISLGGSMVVPDEIDSEFVSEFRKVALGLIDKYRLIIVCGGGKTARKYIEAAKSITDVNADELDWVGIKATHINAELVKAVFDGSLVEDKVVYDPSQKIEFNKDILIGAGWKPGFSTDFDAVLLAEQFNAKKLVNLSNIEYVYDKDPRKFEDAKKIEEMTWTELVEIVGDEWKPGLNAPFDPVATKKARELNLTVAMIKGNDLNSMMSFIDGEEFKGTLIKD